MKFNAFPVKVGSKYSRPPNKDVSQQASSFFVDGNAFRTCVQETEVHLAGCCRLTKDQPGDLAKRMFGSVIR